MSDTHRNFTMTCTHCGSNLSITSDLPITEMVARLEKAHDLLNPHCSQKMAKPDA